MTKKFWRSLTQNEKITIVISSVALLVSSTALWMEFFYQPSRLFVSVPSVSDEDEKLRIDIVYLNSGKTPRMVLSSRFTFGKSLTENESRSTVRKGVQRIVLLPGEARMETLEVEIPKSEFLDQHGLRSKDGSDYVSVGIEFMYLDDRGEIQEHVYRLMQADVQGGSLFSRKQLPSDHSGFVELKGKRPNKALETNSR